ncbi:hypothetical protein YQE_05855, partial [Dendroctonus ponderosae]
MSFGKYQTEIICCAIPLIFVLIGLILKFLNKRSKKSLLGRHVVITGGSSGIGKALAILAAKKGAHVTIVARNVDKLRVAMQEIEDHANEAQKINSASIDVSDKEAIEKNFAELESTVGPIYMLVNCAGLAICGRLEDMKQNDVKHLINVNLLGTIYPIQAVLPKFKERKEGIIVLTASAVALMGMFGYSIYSSCKFALRGLAESLYMEVKPYNISVTLALPPDTDTPGFENENKTKPKETKIMSESGGLYSAETVATQLMNDALKQHFFSSVGFESFVLTTLCIGMSPFHSLVDVIVQSMVIGPFRLFAAFFVKYFESIAIKCYNEEKDKQQ